MLCTTNICYLSFTLLEGMVLVCEGVPQFFGLLQFFSSLFDGSPRFMTPRTQNNQQQQMSVCLSVNMYVWLCTSSRDLWNCSDDVAGILHRVIFKNINRAFFGAI